MFGIMPPIFLKNTAVDNHRKKARVPEFKAILLQ
jgi:hypothetical protein